MIQQNKDNTGSPSWSVPTQPTPPFTRESITLPVAAGGYLPGMQATSYFIEASCAASSEDAAICAGGTMLAEPTACPSGWFQTAYDQCCTSTGSGASCVDPDGLSSSPL